MPTLGVHPYSLQFLTSPTHPLWAWPYYPSLNVFLTAFILANRLCDRRAHSKKQFWEHYTKSYTKTSIATSLKCLVMP